MGSGERQHLMNRITAVPECDATDDDGGTKAGYQNNLKRQYARFKNSFGAIRSEVDRLQGTL